MDFRRGWIVTTWLKAAADGAAGDATADTYFFRLPVKAEQAVVHFLPNNTLTAHDTNFATLNLKEGDGAGGALVTVASRNTKTTAAGGSGDWVAGVPVSLTISDTELAAGSVLAIAITKAAAGVVVPQGELVVALKPRRKR